MLDIYLQGALMERVIWGNTTADYVQAFLVFLFFLIIFKIFQTAVLRYARRIAEHTKTLFDDAVVDIISSFRPPFYAFISFYLGIYLLEISELAEKTLTAVIIAWVVLQVSIAAKILIQYAFRGPAEDASTNAKSIVKALNLTAKIIIWTFGLLLILSNLGINVTSLIAGLGIGGIAVAFALQSILSDLFSSFALYSDRPFEEGDFIVVGEHSGTVKSIGLKSTRIRALQGEEIVIPNKELTVARIQNFKKLERRRIVFAFGVEYGTPIQKIKKIPDMVRGIIGSLGDLEVDRIHFNKFGDSSLDFEVVYFVNESDYALYMDRQQDINIKILEEFEKEKISMAFPTRTVHMVKD